MSTYFDTSTIVKLLVEEPGSLDAEMIWLTAQEREAVALVAVEASAALAAAARARRLSTRAHSDAKHALGVLLEELDLIAVSDDLIDDAAHLAEAHGLRGYDAVHLAAARAIGAQVLSSADQDLCRAAQELGMHVANPLDAPQPPAP